jgi:hypothetical protein
MGASPRDFIKNGVASRMRRLCLLAAMLFGGSLSLKSHPYVPPIDYLKGVDQVCIAKVTSIDGDKTTFEIISTIKGELPRELVLVPALGFSFPKNSEWFLMHLPGAGYWQNHVGYELSGDCEWLPAAAKRVGDNYYFISSAFPNDKLQPETLPDGTKAFSLEQVKKLLAASGQ